MAQRSYHATIRLTIDGLPEDDDVVLARDKAKKLITSGLTSTPDSAVRIDNVVVNSIVDDQ